MQIVAVTLWSPLEQNLHFFLIQFTVVATLPELRIKFQAIPGPEKTNLRNFSNTRLTFQLSDTQSLENFMNVLNAIIFTHYTSRFTIR